jgi:hypothetical protein
MLRSAEADGLAIVLDALIDRLCPVLDGNQAPDEATRVVAREALEVRRRFIAATMKAALHQAATCRHHDDPRLSRLAALLADTQQTER